MKKYIFAILLVMALCCGLLQEECRAEDSADIRMLNDLLGYIYLDEMIYSDLSWAIEYIERFDREKSWENLLLARASLSIAKKDIAACTLPAPEMTPEDYQNLMKRGIDVSFLGMSDVSFRRYKTGLISACTNLTNGIMWGIFLKDEWDIYVRMLRNRKKETEIHIQHFADMVDWVLTSLNNPAMAKKFNTLLEKHCPETHARLRKTPKPLKTIEAESHANIEQLKAVVMEESKIVGAMQQRLNFINDTVEKNALALLYRENRMTISNMPPVVFYPEWFRNTNSNVDYLWRENGEIVMPPKSRTKLTRAPDVCRIEINDVSLDEVKVYQKYLAKMGLPCLWSKEEGGKLKLYYIVKNSNFVIFWEKRQVTIYMMDNPICFVPLLYMPMKSK